MKRLLTFTKNRLANRPHRPRDPVLRKYMKDLGFEWPEPEHPEDSETGDTEDESEDWEESGDEDEEEEDEKCREEENKEPTTGPLGSKGFGSVEEKTEKECETKKGGEGILYSDCSKLTNCFGMVYAYIPRVHDVPHF